MSLLLLAGIFASCSMINLPWGKADDYVAGLQCGMSEDELRNYAERYPQLQIRDPREPQLLIASRENTQILMWMSAEGLTAYQVTWTYPLTNFDSQLKTDLCSGKKYVELNLVGDAELAGAEVWLDDELIGQLSKSGTFTWDVPLGTHELRIETAAGGSWSQSLDYNESSRGHHRLPISINEVSFARSTSFTDRQPGQQPKLVDKCKADVGSRCNHLRLVRTSVPCTRHSEGLRTHGT